MGGAPPENVGGVEDPLLPPLEDELLRLEREPDEVTLIFEFIAARACCT